MANLTTNKIFAQLLRMVLSIIVLDGDLNNRQDGCTATEDGFIQYPSRQDASFYLYRPLVTVSIMPHV